MHSNRNIFNQLAERLEAACPFVELSMHVCACVCVIEVCVCVGDRCLCVWMCVYPVSNTYKNCQPHNTKWFHRSLHARIHTLACVWESEWGRVVHVFWYTGQTPSQTQRAVAHTHTHTHTHTLSVCFYCIMIHDVLYAVRYTSTQM